MSQHQNQATPLYLTFTGSDAVFQVTYWDTETGVPYGVPHKIPSDGRARDLVAHANGSKVSFWSTLVGARSAILEDVRASRATH